MKKLIILVLFCFVAVTTYAQPPLTHQLGAIPANTVTKIDIYVGASNTQNYALLTPYFELKTKMHVRIVSDARSSIPYGGNGATQTIHSLFYLQQPTYGPYTQEPITTTTVVLEAGYYCIHDAATFEPTSTNRALALFLTFTPF